MYCTNGPSDSLPSDMKASHQYIRGRGVSDTLESVRNLVHVGVDNLFSKRTYEQREHNR